MIGAIITPTGMPAFASRSTVSSRRLGVATTGSIARAFSSFQNGMLTITRAPAVFGERLQHVEVALDERRLGDDPDRVPVLGADLEAAAGEPERRLERLVAVGDPAEHQRLALPRALLEVRPEQGGADRLTTILVSKSVPAPKLRYSWVGRA